MPRAADVDVLRKEGHVAATGRRWLPQGVTHRLAGDGTQAAHGGAHEDAAQGQARHHGRGAQCGREAYGWIQAQRHTMGQDCIKQGGRLSERQVIRAPAQAQGRLCVRVPDWQGRGDRSRAACRGQRAWFGRQPHVRWRARLLQHQRERHASARAGRVHHGHRRTPRLGSHILPQPHIDQVARAAQGCALCAARTGLQKLYLVPKGAACNQDPHAGARRKAALPGWRGGRRRRRGDRARCHRQVERVAVGAAGGRTQGTARSARYRGGSCQEAAAQQRVWRRRIRRGGHRPERRRQGRRRRPERLACRQGQPARPRPWRI
mmetsp:Transcript_20670/g.61691  ORF Transcript_20670/g.61691 Transcript_20670/m.61691 type:complete len:320 (+) Transcript_20670:429-1388(+)